MVTKTLFVELVYSQLLSSFQTTGTSTEEKWPNSIKKRSSNDNDDIILINQPSDDFGNVAFQNAVTQRESDYDADHQAMSGYDADEEEPIDYENNGNMDVSQFYLQPSFAQQPLPNFLAHQENDGGILVEPDEITGQ